MVKNDRHEELEKITKEIELAKERLRESNEHVKLLFENTRDTIIWIDPEAGIITNCNRAAEDLFETERHNIVGQPEANLFPPEKSDTYLKMLRELSQEKKTSNRYAEIITSSKAIKPVHISSSTTTSKGNPIIQGIFHDLSLQKNNENAHKKRLTYEKMISDISTKAVWVESIEVFFNECLEIMGPAIDVSRVYIFKHDYVSNLINNTSEWFCADQKPRISGLQNIPANTFPWLLKMLINRQILMYQDIEDIPGDEEKEFLRSHRVKSFIAFPLFINNTYYGFLGFDECRERRQWLAEDVNILYTIARIMTGSIERSQAEESVRESEKKHRLLLDNSGSSIAYFDKEGKLILANKNFALDFKKDLNSLIGKSLDELFPKDEAGYYLQRFKKTMRKKKGMEFEKSVRVSRGKNWRLENIQPVKDANDNVSGIVMISTDIHERKNAEEALRRSEERYRLLAENASDVIWTLDPELKWTYISLSIKQLREYSSEESMDHSIDDILSPASAKLAKKIFKQLLKDAKGEINHSRSAKSIELEVICKDGSTVWTESKISVLSAEDKKPMGIVGVTRNISQKRQAESENIKLQSQLRRAQKMEAIGSLAGGIAHDFENIISPIFGYAGMTVEDVPKESIARKNIEEVIKASNRAMDLIRQILIFSRQAEQNLMPLLLHPIINQVIKQLRSTTPKNIGFQIDMDEKCGTVLADPERIQQAIMNLCTNSYHAMMDKGGILSVSLFEMDTDMELPFEDSTVNPGHYVKLTVNDTGHGMTQNTIEQIFNPYFTTKKSGEGTGMGLAMVHGIVKSHEGHIHIESTPEKGTTVDIYLPRAEAIPEELRETFKGEIPTGNEHILLVDDEEQIVAMEQQMLERLGYKVTSRTSSLEALEAFRIQPNSFDIVITDMTMPNLTGDQFAQELIKIRSDIPIILCAGFSDTITKKTTSLMGFRDLVMKPVVKNQIAESIRNVLDSKNV